MDVSTPINDFGLRLLRTLTDGSGKNVVVSPLSVSLALAMTCNGAAGDTRTSIAKTLGAESLTDEAINRNSRLLLDMVEKADPEAQMEVANALWTQSGFPIDPDFLKLNRDYYDASVESLDFEGNPRNAANTINAWVNDKTHAKIPEILRDVSRETVVVLTDAVYFKGRWSMPFDKNKTETRTFHLRGGNFRERADDDRNRFVPILRGRHISGDSSSIRKPPVRDVLIPAAQAGWPAGLSAHARPAALERVDRQAPGTRGSDHSAQI